MSFYIAWMSGYTLVLLVSLGVLVACSVYANNPKGIYAHRVRVGCIASAELEEYSEDDTNGVISANYSYHWAGRSYIYTKHYFNEAPAQTLDISWDPANPANAEERGDIHVDRASMRKKVLTTIILLAVVAIPGNHIWTMVLGIVLGVCLLLHSKPLKAGLIATAVALLVINTLAQYGSNLYNEYDHERYISTQMRLAAIDEMEPWEVAELYDDYYYQHMDWVENTSSAGKPFMCQYADRWYTKQKEMKWPSHYYRYTDWEYRDKIIEEHENANP